MKILFIWDWPVDAPELFSNNQEKLQAWRKLGETDCVTIAVMSERYGYKTTYEDGVRYASFNRYRELLDFILYAGEEFDIIVSWGSIDRPIHSLLISRKNDLPPLCLQFAGGPHDGEQLSLFSHIFVQNACDKEEFEFRKIPCTQLFGVDKSFWTPNPFQEKTIEAIYPASFCNHKRNEYVAEKYKEGAVLMGKWIDQGIVDTCKSYGSLVLPDVNHEVLREFYRASKKCYIPAIAGSQRTVAEALSCGVEIEYDEGNQKVREIMEGEINLLSIPEMAEIYRKELSLCQLTEHKK